MHQQDKKPNRPAMPGRRKEVTEKQNRKVVAWQRRCACDECDVAEWEGCTEQEYQAALEDPEMQARELCVCEDSAAQSAPIEDRGWPDRDYWCKCCVCGEMFTGHKRQVICRICTEESAAQSAPAGEREHED